MTSVQGSATANDVKTSPPVGFGVVVVVMLVVSLVQLFTGKGLEVSSRELAPAEVAAVAADFNRPADAVPVLLFATKWCPICKELQETLTKRGIAFEWLDIESDPRGRRLYTLLTGRPSGAIPVTLARGKLIEGFQPDLVSQALGVPLPGD